MKYKNIVFDFGNVIGKFNGRDLVKQFFFLRRRSGTSLYRNFFKMG